MKINLNAQDMKQVGFSIKSGCFHMGCCPPETGNEAKAPLFQRTAVEYAIVCSGCGKPIIPG